VEHPFDQALQATDSILESNPATASTGRLCSVGRGIRGLRRVDDVVGRRDACDRFQPRIIVACILLPRACGVRARLLPSAALVVGMGHFKKEYELRVLSRVPLYTTLSIWTFVTNQRRILDDNAPKNSRSGAQLLVVKIPPWLFAVLVQKGHHKVKNASFL
jgi:hypothetical protein